MNKNSNNQKIQLKSILILGSIVVFVLISLSLLFFTTVSKSSADTETAENYSNQDLSNAKNQQTTEDNWSNFSDVYQQELSETHLDLSKADYQTLVENINFAYFIQQKSLKYSGTVAGNNGCIFVEKSLARQENAQKIILEVFLDKLDPKMLCTQAITQLKVQGQLDLELNPEQLKNYQDLFEVKIIQKNIDTKDGES